jgi:hypothetical protein
MASYSEHARTIDKFYQNMTENLALTVSETLDGSNLRPILEAAHDSAY